MCGIAGILLFDEGTEPQSSTVQRMTAAMTHRGPNQNGIQVVDRIGLGFNRLSILDLEDGSQPMTNEDNRLWLIFNGEIYNYKPLRQLLENKGHRFKTNTDSEVLLHLYEEYEENCVDYLRGMFSFAIWDRNEQILFAARDHFGIKPFYFYQDHKQFLFASEIKSILAADGVVPTVNPNSLLHYLTFQYVPQPETMFQGIKKLEPGYCLRIDSQGNKSIKRYWQAKFEPENRPIETFVEEIRFVLQESVHLHRQSDVPRGSFLSGGIDSSAIATYMSRSESTKTFSVGFSGENNETVFAKQTAASLGTEHFDEIISPHDFFMDTMKAVWHMDEPIADPSAIAIYRLSKLAREHVTVVLSGEGADELFGGYRIYREPSSLKAVTWLPDRIRSFLEKMIRRMPFSFYGKNYLLRGLTHLEDRYFGNARIFNEDEKRTILASHPDLNFPWVPSKEITRLVYDHCRSSDDVTRMQTIDMNLWLPGDILMKADKMSMAHSLELRVPFLDKEVFNIARKIPASYRIANGTTKYVLRKAMEGIVPAHVLDRPKLGFPVPLRKWLHTDIGDTIVEQIAGSNARQWFHMDHIKDMLKKHRSGAGDYSRKIWTIYIFSLWHSLYINNNSVNYYPELIVVD
ncbi:asparagine synthase (glutamine-hydrolyzing) [Paenibacillus spongiae]|uniref:asparagine synthase (glutamine-hydrolyzing) n=1 Tax=Paenibacillus spongiae TaxID=2909671 RepID=A0ABY5SHI3_9BACL|nr:asparagine synthase (glutamine-hydrolyzing) [Paenibacillus spongiae]UVI33444.1 asparagine synthase (glutamine-hydrolyzing) [Paenibacillus spongiae]